MTRRAELYGIIGVIGLLIALWPLYKEEIKPTVRLIAPTGKETITDDVVEIVWEEHPGFNAEITRRAFEYSLGNNQWFELERKNAQDIVKRRLIWTLRTEPSAKNYIVRVKVMNSHGLEASHSCMTPFEVVRLRDRNRVKAPPQESHDEDRARQPTNGDAHRGNVDLTRDNEPEPHHAVSRASPTTEQEVVSTERPVVLVAIGEFDGTFEFNPGDNLVVLGQKRGRFRIKTSCAPIHTSVVYGGKRVGVRDLGFVLTKPSSGTVALEIELKCEDHVEKGRFLVSSGL